MSPEWREEVRGHNPRPHGEHSAIRAVLEWCLAGSTDIRMTYVLTSTDSAQDGSMIGRALHAGGWNGQGLARLEEILADDGAKQVELASAFLDRRQQEAAR